MWCLLVSDSQHLAHFSLTHTLIQRSSSGNIRAGIWRFVGWVLPWCLRLQSAFGSGCVSRAADELCFTLCSSMSPSSSFSSSDLEMCKQHLDVASPVLFKLQWWTKLSLSLRQHCDSRWIWLWFLPASVDTFAAASGGSSSQGAVDALLDSLSSEAHFFPAALDSGPLIYSIWFPDSSFPCWFWEESPSTAICRV